MELLGKGRMHMAEHTAAQVDDRSFRILKKRTGIMEHFLCPGLPCLKVSGPAQVKMQTDDLHVSVFSCGADQCLRFRVGNIEAESGILIGADVHVQPEADFRGKVILSRNGSRSFILKAVIQHEERAVEDHFLHTVPFAGTVDYDSLRRETIAFCQMVFHIRNNLRPAPQGQNTPAHRRHIVGLEGVGDLELWINGLIRPIQLQVMVRKSVFLKYIQRRSIGFCRPLHHF